MLDEPQYGKPDPREPLKCESCGLYFSYEEDQENWESIDNTGHCIECPIN
jgi:hypothetical protein